ncbi:MAG: glycosyltransferase family 4 protein [Candidatus Gastranaerophilales bacterium]|nr:glycosyltransferase family 4 protein [Candidatus Gastranaerophilales bacterium]
MKFAFITRKLEDNNFYGGGEKMNYRLITELIKKGHTVHIFCNEVNLKYDNQIDKEGIFIVPEPFVLTQERRNTELKEYDIVFSENLGVANCDAVYVHGHSTLYRLKEVRHPLENFVNKLFQPKRFSTLTTDSIGAMSIIETTNLVFVPSELLKYDFKKYLETPAEKIHVLYPGIDIPAEYKEFKRADEKNIVFGMSAVGFDIKGGYIFLAALHHLKKKFKNFKARIIYPGAEKNSLTKAFTFLLGIHSNVEFLPFQEDMSEFYNSIDAIVMSSRQEAFGLVAPEAMSYGKIVITTERCGACEIVQDGVSGFVAPYGKTPAKNLAVKMLEMVKSENRFDEIATKGYEKVQTLSWQNFTEEFLKAAESKISI